MTSEDGMHNPISLDLPEPQQERSLRTQQSFVDAGWAILQEQPWESVSITAIAKRAGRSVGVFYQRFGSKEDFLSVLLNRWLEMSTRSGDVVPPITVPTEFIDWYLHDAFDRIRANRYLWRAALQRALDDPRSWDPFRMMGKRRRQKLAENLGTLRGQPLDAEERHRLDLAVQVFNSMINNALLNDPGPLHVEQSDFFPTVKQIFLTVAALDFGPPR